MCLADLAGRAGRDRQTPPSRTCHYCRQPLNNSPSSRWMPQWFGRIQCVPTDIRIRHRRGRVHALIRRSHRKPVSAAGFTKSRVMMAERMKLPVLPMRETVVLPGVAVPISAGRPGTLEAVEKVLEGERRLFAVCQRENVDDPTPSVLYEMGVIVRILQVQRTPAGLQLLIQGVKRAKALRYERVGETMLEADVWVIEDEPTPEARDAAFIALDRELRERAAELGRRRGMPPEALAQIVQGVEEPGAFADMVAFYLEQPAKQKQELLE